MTLHKLFKMQHDLDQYILTEHGLQEEDLVDEKMLALFVEVGELANETRCFKFWSNKSASARAHILEEFVDGVHFILSIGLDLGYSKRPISLQSAHSNENLIQSFLT